ncbi:hypothetical protein SL053_002589 [Flavobacterium psychrophilum]|nr:hypothetical protein [Flavobacterium psychrophilum]
MKNQLTSVDCKNKNSLFDKIDGKLVNFKNLNFDDEIEIINVKGNWLNIKNTTINKNYWVKWKEKNKLLINLNLLM